MEDITLVVKTLLETHDKDDDVYRVASDWLRLRHDLSRQWRNKSVEEIQLNSPLFCCMCSGRETGLVCERCIMQADEEIAGE